SRRLSPPDPHPRTTRPTLGGVVRGHGCSLPARRYHAARGRRPRPSRALWLADQSARPGADVTSGRPASAIDSASTAQQKSLAGSIDYRRLTIDDRPTPHPRTPEPFSADLHESPTHQLQVPAPSPAVTPRVPPFGDGHTMPDPLDSGSE